MKNHLWNMITAIRNGQLVKKAYIIQKKKKINETILHVLWNEGFILGYKSIDSRHLKIYLKYRNSKPAISHIKSLSKPGFRVYYSLKELWKYDTCQGLLIISTSKGVLSVNECKNKKVGGEPFLIVK
jgi:small subunit ribosomal protein S8